MLIYCEPAVRAGGPVNEPASHTPSSHRARAATAGAVLALAIAVAVGWPPARSSGGQAPPRPNVIVVMTDDQTVAELTPRHDARDDAALADARHRASPTASSPARSAVPSRAGFLTGQYPHNSGVFDNEPGYASLIDKDSTVYAWLQAAGYRTGHVGRFLLNYDREPAARRRSTTPTSASPPPPGVEDWFGYVGSADQVLRRHLLRQRHPGHRSAPARATTRPSVINREALDFVRDAEGRPAPLLPHRRPPRPALHQHPRPRPLRRRRPADPRAAATSARGRTRSCPKPPSFDESKIPTSPTGSRPARRSAPSRRREPEARPTAARSPPCRTVDRGVGALVDQLERQGELDNTAIFFTSDNGYFFGEHRIFLNKVYPYEEALRVPLLARVPPTLLGAARRRHGRPPRDRRPGQQPRPDRDHPRSRRRHPVHRRRRTAARSTAARCVPLLRGERPDWSRGARPARPARRQPRPAAAIPTERGLNNFYDAIRTKRYVYVELDRVNSETGLCDRPEYELYDLKRDPYQLHNQAREPGAAAPSPLQAELAARLDALRDCAGSPAATPPPATPCE